MRGPSVRKMRATVLSNRATKKGAEPMSTYITLVNYTEQGIKTVKDSPSRVDAGKALAKSLGGEMKQLFLTMGAYDMVAVSEFPDDEAAAKFSLILGSKGNVRTTNMLAFPEDQMRSVIDSLP